MSIASYRLGIRTAVRGLWKGWMEYDQAYEQMYLTIDMGLRNAWYEGMREAGLVPADMTTKEEIALKREVVKNQGYIDGFLSACEEYSQANGYKLSPLFARAEVWVNRYLEVRNIALTMAINDPKLEWVMGVRIEHCIDCIRLDGKVKRASVWEANDVRPQHPDLECGGWKCGCEFMPTDKPCTPGTIHTLTGRKVLV